MNGWRFAKIREAEWEGWLSSFPSNGIWACHQFIMACYRCTWIPPPPLPLTSQGSWSCEGVTNKHVTWHATERDTNRVACHSPDRVTCQLYSFVRECVSLFTVQFSYCHQILRPCQSRITFSLVRGWIDQSWYKNIVMWWGWTPRHGFACQSSVAPLDGAQNFAQQQQNFFNQFWASKKRSEGPWMPFFEVDD